MDISKDINIVRKVNLPHAVRDATKTLHASPITNRHSIEGPTSLEVATRRLSTIDTPTVIPKATEIRLAHAIAPPTTSFYPRTGAEGIFATSIQVMGSKY